MQVWSFLPAQGWYQAALSDWEYAQGWHWPRETLAGSYGLVPASPSPQASFPMVTGKTYGVRRPPGPRGFVRLETGPELGQFCGQSAVSLIWPIFCLVHSLELLSQDKNFCTDLPLAKVAFDKKTISYRFRLYG